METEWQFDTADGHRIHGILSSSGERSGAIFVVHGLTSTMQDYVLKRAADFFASRYDVYRFDLYGGGEKARALVDCTLQTHAEDLRTVLAGFASRYGKVFLIGHSYGGPTIMIANPDGVSAVSLWDPSFDLRKTQTDFASAFEKIPQGYLMSYGVTTLMGNAMYDEAFAYDETACTALAKAFKTPLQVINAGDGILIQRGKSYHTDCPQRTDYQVVAGTTHCFVENDTADDLLRRTATWFAAF